MSTRGFVGYQHRGKIRGWYNHSDSYPDCLGETMVRKFVKHTQSELQDFFLNRMKLTDDEHDYEHHRSVNDLDWKKDSITLKDGKDFYKDGLFCEYAYIFDLDQEEKSLMLFKGFGTKPDKERKDWFYKSEEHFIKKLDGTTKKDRSTKHYVNLVGTIQGDLKEIPALVQLYLAYLDKEEPEENILELVKIGDTNESELPTLIGMPKSELGKKYLEWRLKGEL